LNLPLEYYAGFVRRQAYGLSNQTFQKWAQDAGIRLLLRLGFGVLLAWLPYHLLKKSPRRWWLYTWLAAIPLAFANTIIQPLWIAPLFNDFGPMQNKTLEADILELAARSGIEDGRVFEVAKSEDTNVLNAYATGFGATKRIVLWDTLLAKMNREQVLMVMGHEMGHYVLGHTWIKLTLRLLVALASLYWVHRSSLWLMTRYGKRFGFHELSDVASMPLLIVLATLVQLAASPLLLAGTRHFEREADRFALEITQDNYAAATTFLILQQENLGVPRPSWLYVWWRMGHPSLGDRIDFSNDYRPWESNEPLVYGHLFANP
jgi:Zn-dependent protease with chaperone function